MKNTPRGSIAAIVVFFVLGSSAAIRADNTDISGHWIVNDERSDSLADKMKELRKQDRRSRPRKPPGEDATIPGGPMPGGGNVAGIGGRRAHEGGPRLGAIRQMVSAGELEISQSDTVTIVYENDIARILRPNPAGRVYTASGKELSADDVGDTLTFWDKTTLVVETRSHQGGMLTERFDAATSPGQLLVTLELKMPGRTQKLHITRIYDRAGTRDGDRPDG